MIIVSIATTLFCSSALIILSAVTVIFPKDVIKSPGKDQETGADHEGRNV
jgi:hypothetical protein